MSSIRSLLASPCRSSPTRELLVLALPIIGLSTSRMLMGFVDFVMVSWMGTEAQAAISPSSLFVFVLACLGMGVATSVQTYVSQCAGRGEPHECGAYAWQPLYLALVLAVVTYPVVAYLDVWFRPVAALGQHPPHVVEMELAYMRIALWSIVPSVLCVGLEGFFNGIQRPKVALVAVVVALGANILGNWILIFGKLGLPAMGIAGAALATVIGWWIRVGIMVAALVGHELNERYHTRAGLALHWQKLVSLIRLGGPTAVQWFVDIGSWVVFMMLIVPPLGLPAMAATNVGLQVMHASFMPAIGVGIALCSQVGFAIGAGRPEEAMMRTRVALRFTGGYMGAVGLIFLFARHPLIYVFNIDPEVIAAGGHVLIWAAIFQVFDAMGITFMNALRGAGDTRWPALLMAFCCWVVFIGGGWATVRLAPQWGLNGPWAMCTSYIILVGIGLAWRWHGRRWQHIRLFGQSSNPQPEAAAVTNGAIAAGAAHAADADRDANAATDNADAAGDANAAAEPAASS